MIYFLRGGESGPVKIGWSRDRDTLAQRIATLQCGYPERLLVVRSIEGERWAEAWLHGFFVGVKITGEWFKFTEEMLTIAPPTENPRLLSKRRVALNSPKELSMISNALSAARIAAGITQQDLADLLGVTQAFVSHIEVGRRALPEKLRGKLPEPIRGAVIKATKAELRERIKRLDRLGKEPNDAGTGR